MGWVLNKVFSQTNAVFLVLALKAVMQSENQNIKGLNKRRSIKQAVLVQSPYVLFAHCDLVFLRTVDCIAIYTTGNS